MFLRFCNFFLIFGGRTDKQTDRQTDLGIKAPSRSLKPRKYSFVMNKKIQEKPKKDVHIVYILSIIVSLAWICLTITSYNYRVGFYGDFNRQKILEYSC